MNSRYANVKDLDRVCVGASRDERASSALLEGTRREVVTRACVFFGQCSDVPGPAGRNDGRCAANTDDIPTDALARIRVIGCRPRCVMNVGVYETYEDART